MPNDFREFGVKRKIIDIQRDESDNHEYFT